MVYRSQLQDAGGDGRPSSIRAERGRALRRQEYQHHIRVTRDCTALEGPLSKADEPQAEAKISEMRIIPCREKVGVLMWINAMMRPDLSFVVYNLNKFDGNPGPAHWKSVTSTLQYSMRTVDLRVTYGGD